MTVLDFQGKFILGEDNLISCCTGTQEKYIGLVHQPKNNNLKFQGWHTLK